MDYLVDSTKKVPINVDFHTKLLRGCAFNDMLLSTINNYDKLIPTW